MDFKLIRQLPGTLWSAVVMELFERLAYYGMVMVLGIYIVDRLGSSRRHLRLGVRHFHGHSLLPAGARRGPGRPIRLQTGPDRGLRHPHRRVFPARGVDRLPHHLRRPRSDRDRRFDHQTDDFGRGDPHHRGRQHPTGGFRSLLHDDQRRRADRPGGGGPGSQPFRVQLCVLGVGRGLRPDVGPGHLRLPRSGARGRTEESARASPTSSARSSWCSPTGALCCCW